MTTEDPAVLTTWKFLAFKGLLFSRVLRYEDFMADVRTQARTILDFAGLPEHKNVFDFLTEHDVKVDNKSQAPWSTFRDARTVTTHWKTDLAFTTIRAIQSKCRTALMMWGYRSYDSEKDLHLNATLTWSFRI